MFLDDHLSYGFGDFRFQIVIEDGEAEQDEAALRLISLLRGKHQCFSDQRYYSVLVRSTQLRYIFANMTVLPLKPAKGQVS